MPIRTRRLGRTERFVTEVGLGGGPLGAFAPTDGEARDIVEAAYSLGIRYFDCAPLYSGTRSEHMIGDGLRGKSDWVLSTKVGHIMRPDSSGPAGPGFAFRQHFDYSYDGVMRSVEASYQRLGLSRIDILYIHDLDIFTHGERYREMFETAMDGAYRALDELRRNGDVGGIGLGVNDAQPVADALDRGQWDVFLLAGRYTLLEQHPLGLLAKVQRSGASIVLGGPFNSGILVGRGDWNYKPAPAAVIERTKRLAAVCDSHGVPLAAAALQFPLAHPAVAAVVPGARSVDEINQIVAWSQQAIPPALWDDLLAGGLLARDAPVPA